MNNIVTLSFDNKPIHQQAGDGYLNATDMCKAAGKLWGNYWQTQGTKAYLEALSSDIGIPISELVRLIKGGRPLEQGTWVHPKVAIHLAQWLSPEFAVWCTNILFDHINGQEKIAHEDGGDIIQMRIAREKRLMLRESMNLMKELGLEGNQKIIAANRMTRKLTGTDFMDAAGVSYLVAPQNTALLTVTDIGKSLGGKSAIKVNELLFNFGFQTGKKDDKGRHYWEPTPKGLDNGAVMTEVERTNKTGMARQLRWSSEIIDILQTRLQGAQS